MDALLRNSDRWAIHHGDCIEIMATLPDACFDLSIYSPPFPSMYAYTDESCDIGNSEDFRGDAKLHLSFFFHQIARLIKPGRVMVVHCMQIPRMKRCGEVGMHDFRGLLIRLAERAGLIYEYDWAVRKNPQALRDGTDVWTPTGMVAINRLNVGDRVIGSDGNATDVVGVWPHSSRQMYRVKFSDGESIECDAQHIWNVNKNVCRYDSERVNVTTEFLYETGAAMQDGKSYRWAVPMCRAGVEFDAGEPLPMDPYLLGVLLGDGMLSSRGVVGICTERAIVESLVLPDGHRTRKLKGSDRGNDVASYHIGCREWHRNDVLDTCRDLGIAGKRAWEKEIPSPFLMSSKQDRLALLQGLMDTDGTIKKNGSCYFASTSLNLGKGVQFLTESLGGICRISREENPRYKHKGEVKYGRVRYVCCVRLPTICPFRLPAKASKWKPLARTIHRRIVSIEKTVVSDCTCITVAAEDGLFVTEHGIVTHNSQAIRTRSRELQFVGLERDRAKTRGCLHDYLIKFRAPGENVVAIDSKGEVSRNEWIKWAEGTWDDIRETDTLNVKDGRGDDDTKHICPLQLGVIRRLVKLFSNPGEVVFSPFTGIGSEGYVAVKEGRRFYGCEIKQEYYDAARANLKRAEAVEDEQLSLFTEAM